MSSPSPVHRAYARLDVDYSERTEALFKRLDKLLELGLQNQSELLRKMKPTIAVALKWKFDYLCKTLESPFDLAEDVEYWIRALELLHNLGAQQWFDFDAQTQSVDPWERTAKGFDLGWTTTTEGERFEASKKIAKERTDQILEILGGSKYIEGKDILDSGCGPGRYIDLLRVLSPKRICGMDQGVKLVEVLKGRFKDEPIVEIFHGTCEKLEFPDNSFDFVVSNGVLHHTSSDLETMLKDHARVLRPGGAMFIMLVGKGGLELKIWEFIRGFLNDVPLETMLEIFGNSMSPLRLQGIVDHMYGEYQETSKEEFEGWCDSLFDHIERVPGIEGLDVTREIYKNDRYFESRFGCGHIRYLCYK